MHKRPSWRIPEWTDVEEFAAYIHEAAEEGTGITIIIENDGSLLVHRENSSESLRITTNDRVEVPA